VEVADDAQAGDGRLDQRVRGGGASLRPEAVAAVVHRDEHAVLLDGEVLVVVAERGDDGELGAEALDVVGVHPKLAGAVDHGGVLHAAAPVGVHLHPPLRARLLDDLGEDGVAHGRLDAAGLAVEGVLRHGGVSRLDCATHA
jgi:hypothetical protein